MFTTVPFAIIGGGVLILVSLGKTPERVIQNQVILFGILVILVGISTFGFYLWD